MWSGFIAELRRQFYQLSLDIRTAEFWTYVGVVVALCAVAGLGIYYAMGFDPLTRGHLSMMMSCRTGDGQIATIIIGLFVFGLAAVFSLGEVVQWVEAKRRARISGRPSLQQSPVRPLLHVGGTLALGIGGFVLMSAWCS